MASMFTRDQAWGSAWAEAGLEPDIISLEGPHPSLQGESMLRTATAHFQSSSSSSSSSRSGGQPAGLSLDSLHGAAPDASGRCWWYARQGAGDAGLAASEWSYVGVEESLCLVEQALRHHGPVDCLLGFSQGASLAALCLALLPQAPCAAVLVAGFAPRDAALARRLTEALPRLQATRTLHVMGRRDPIVPPAVSHELCGLLCEAGEGVVAETCEHRGGHGGWRRDKEVRRSICQFISKAAEEADAVRSSSL